MREPKWPGAPIAMPSPGSGLKIARATVESSSLLITLTTAAIVSLDSPSLYRRTQSAAEGRSRICFSASIVRPDISASADRFNERSSAAVTPSSTNAAAATSPIRRPPIACRASPRTRGSVVPPTSRSPSLNSLARTNVWRRSKSAGAKLDDAFGAGFGDVDRPVAGDGEVVNGVEDRIARGAETDRCDGSPVAIELQHAVGRRVVVGPANPDVDRSAVVHGDREDAAGCLGAEPLPLERTLRVEHLDARILAVGDEDIAAGTEGEAVRVAELSVAISLRAPLPGQLPTRIEQRDAAVHVAIGHVQGSILANGDICRLVEMRRVPAADARLSERQQELSVMGELEHLLQADVGEPQVVVGVDRDPVRDEKHPGAPRREQLAAVAVELEDRRRREQLGRVGFEPAAGGMEDEHMTVSIDVHAGDFPELDARRQLRPVLDLLIRRGRRRDGRSCERRESKDDDDLFHDGSTLS